MARKTKKITIEKAGRDQGKTYLITEMSVCDAEQWASRAIVAILNSGNTVDFNIDPKEGMLGLISKAMDMLTGIRSDDILPLWNELLSCAQFIESSGNARALLLGEGSEDIEEFTTIMQLKKEAFNLHVDFIKSVAGSIFPQAGNPSQESRSTETAPI